jgi:hypothetical protein
MANNGVGINGGKSNGYSKLHERRGATVAESSVREAGHRARLRSAVRGATGGYGVARRARRVGEAPGRVAVGLRRGAGFRARLGRLSFTRRAACGESRSRRSAGVQGRRVAASGPAGVQGARLARHGAVGRGWVAAQLGA